jgi:hypothetical protein
MNELKYPHLFLFTYNLGINVSQTGNTKFPKEGEEEFAGNLAVKGFSTNRFSLADTEANLFCCAAATSESQNSQPLSCFQDFKDKINSKFRPTANLHKTWMLVGYSPEINQENAKIIAKEAYQSFVSHQKWPSDCEAGQFMGATIFEIWKSDQNWQNLAAEENSRIVIIIFPDQEIMTKIAAFSEDWVKLFYYRNKILLAYSDVLQIKAKLDLPTNFFPAEITLPNQDDNLENLKIKFSKNIENLYALIPNLALLEAQNQTIKDNLHNYEERLNKIEKKARDIENGVDTQLNCLRVFIKNVKHKYQVQVDKEIAILTSSLKVKENVINTLRGMVEIQQIESDRNLQLEIATFGIGLGAASATASIVTPLVEVITPFPTKKIENGKEILIPANAVLNFGLALIISAAIGAIGIACGFAGGKLWSRMRSRRK